MPSEGKVFLVGAGPGDPDLITVAGLAQLSRADVVVYDRLVDPRLLERVPPHCERIPVGKRPGGQGTSQERIHEILLEQARLGKRVVRLKGGDPFVFGRGAEERQACRLAGIECRVIPGVSSAIAAPASVGIPITHRQVARTSAILTGHSADLDYRALAGLDTLVILMGRARLDEICRGLARAGKTPETPAAAVERATTEGQRWVVADLGSIAREVERASLEAPLVVIIGEVAGMGDSPLVPAPAGGHDHEVE